jgi:signal transduction histidine kinase
VREARTRVTFVNQVSHELKTPLTNIRMYSEMLESRLPSRGKERKYASVLVRESDRLSRMIRNVLSFSRESEQIRCQDTAPDQVIREVIEACRPRLRDRKMTVKFRGKADGPVCLDRDILEQVVWNLLSNAEKYAFSGGSVVVDSRITGSLLEVKVTDRGPGIVPSMKKKVFDPFVRGRQDLTEGVSGTGLGLSISRELARRHGGDLVLEEGPEGRGCRFILTLKEGSAE